MFDLVSNCAFVSQLIIRVTLQIFFAFSDKHQLHQMQKLCAALSNMQLIKHMSSVV